MKQRKFLLIALICLLVFTVGIISACDTIDGIIGSIGGIFGKSVSAVKLDGSQLGELKAGDTADFSKLKITAEYSDGSTEELSLADVQLVINGIQKDIVSMKVSAGQLKIKVGYEVKGEVVWSNEVIITVSEAVHVHDLVKTEAKQPTCTEAGNSAYWTCSSCHKFFADAQGEQDIPTEGQWIIPALGHSTSKTAAKAATCELEGNVEYYTCERCHKTFADAQGARELTSVAIPALGHSAEKVDGQVATCTADGWKDYYRCTHEGCTKLFSDAEAQHEITDLAAWKAGEGKLAMGAHGGEEISLAPTCEVAGHKAYFQCAGCEGYFAVETGEAITDLDAWKAGEGKIAPLDHEFGAWQQTTAPTCTAKGEETRYCTREGCEHYETRPVDELGHSFGAWVQTTAPTCTEKGEETRYCQHEGCMETETRPVDELGHEFGAWQQTTAPTCTAKGEETRYCQHEGCVETETRPVDELGHSFKWILNEESNEYEYRCEREGCTEFGGKDAMPKALASQKILLTDAGAALELPEGATAATVGSVSVLVNLDALKADRNLHGEQTVIVKKVFDGQELEFTKEVLFVTAEISTFNQFWENIHHNKGMANSGGYFEQTADILIEAHYGSTTDRYIRSGDVPSNTSEGCFTGTYDGQGHSITYKVGTFVYQNAGLFGGLSGATIKNVNVTLGTISNWSVGFASRVTNSTLENIKVAATNCANSANDAWMFVYCTAGANVYRNIVLDITGAEMYAHDFVVDHFRTTEKFENYYIVGADFEKITMDGNELPEGVTLLDKANAEVKVESNSIALGLDGYTLVSAKIGATALTGCAIEGSNLVVPGASLEGLTGGQILTLTLSKDSKEEVKSFGLYVASKVIKSAQDLKLVAYAGGDNLTGLYVLEEDLDLQGATLTASGNKWDGGFVGTFAGNGHKISNATFGYGGMFGAIGGGARVIHFTLDQASYSDADGSCAIGAIYNNSCVASIVINVKRATANTNTSLISYNASAGYPNKLQITVNAQNLYVGCLVGKEYQTGHYDNASTNVVLNVGGYNTIGKGTKGTLIEFTKDLMPKKTTINIVDDHTTLGWVYNSEKFGYEWKCLCCGADAPETKPIMYKVVAKNPLIDLTNPETLSSLLPAGTKSAKFNNIELIKDGAVDFTEINKFENHSKHGVGHITIIATVDGQDLEFQIESATVATKLISTWEEFNTYIRATQETCPAETDKEKGYFVQTADIVIPASTNIGSQQGKWVSGIGNYGVFGGKYDGQGYKIDATGGFWGNSGIFGSIHGATISNVNIEYKANSYTTGFSSFFAYSIINNVTIKVTALGGVDDLWVFGYAENNGNTIKNITIDVSAVSLGAKQRIANDLFGTANNSTYENVVIKAKSIVDINAKGTTAATLPTGVTLQCQHDFAKVEAKPATRFESGNNEYYTCPYCKATYKDEARTQPTTIAEETLAGTFIGRVYNAGIVISSGDPWCNADNVTLGRDQHAFFGDSWTITTISGGNTWWGTGGSYSKVDGAVGAVMYLQNNTDATRDITVKFGDVVAKTVKIYAHSYVAIYLTADELATIDGASGRNIVFTPIDFNKAGDSYVLSSLYAFDSWDKVIADEADYLASREDLWAAVNTNALVATYNALSEKDKAAISQDTLDKLAAAQNKGQVLANVGIEGWFSPASLTLKRELNAEHPEYGPGFSFVITEKFEQNNLYIPMKDWTALDVTGKVAYFYFYNGSNVTYTVGMANNFMRIIHPTNNYAVVIGGYADMTVEPGWNLMVINSDRLGRANDRIINGEGKPFYMPVFELEAGSYFMSAIYVVSEDNLPEHIVAVAEKASSCTVKGNDAYWKSEKTGQLYSDADCTQKISAIPERALLAHSYAEVADEKYLVSAATCTAKAVYKKSCSVCGAAHATETFEYGELAAHKYAEVADEKYLVSAATCTAKAVYKKSCSVCGAAHATETFEYGELAAHAYDDETHTCVCGKLDPAFVMATIGSNEYLSVAAAVEAAQAGETVKLVADIALTETLAIGKSITLDLNGKAITATNFGENFYMIKASGEGVVLGIVDSSESNTGKVDVADALNAIPVTAAGSAKVIIRAGKFISIGTSVEDPAGSECVYVASDGSAEIYGGVFQVREGDGTKDLLNVQNEQQVSQMTVYGGTFVGRNPADGDDALGGTFVAEGYQAVETETGIWTVSEIQE